MVKPLLAAALLLTACASTPPSRAPHRPVAQVTTGQAAALGAIVGLMAVAVAWQFVDKKTERAIP